MTGLTSISFRMLSVDQIIALAKESELAGIEWGSDVHVRPGDRKAAESAAEHTRQAGLAVTSYGSYLKAGEEEGEQAFDQLLVSAKILKAPVIRVWAGSRSPADADPAYRQKVADHLRRLVESAGQEGIRVATEYHRRTLTQDASSALSLLEAVPGLYTYWQPNPELDFAHNLEELRAVGPYLLNVHVFQWEGAQNFRHPLADGEREWTAYIQEVSGHEEQEHHFLLEFVKNDDPRQCLEDAAVLNRLWKKGRP